MLKFCRICNGHGGADIFQVLFLYTKAPLRQSSTSYLASSPENVQWCTTFAFLLPSVVEIFFLNAAALWTTVLIVD